MLKTSHVLLTTVLAMSVVFPARSKAQTSSVSGGALFVMTNAADNNQIVPTSAMRTVRYRNGKYSPQEAGAAVA